MWQSPLLPVLLSHARDRSLLPRGSLSFTGHLVSKVDERQLSQFNENIDSCQ